MDVRGFNKVAASVSSCAAGARSLIRAARSSSALRRVSVGAGWCALILFGLDRSAWAIPSPDLVIGLFASTAQVLALGTIVFGRWFFGGGRKSAAANAGNGNAYRIAFFASSGLFVATLAGWLLYAMKQDDLRSQRLQVNLERNSKEDGKKIVDVSLKELPFSEQLLRNDGLRTDELLGWIEAPDHRQVLDVRESEEYEMGRIAGAKHVRYPDLMKAPEDYLDKSKPVLLLCYNGNRSSELCNSLEPLGYDCHFMIGGYEKWIAEERELDMAGERSPDELRQIPAYPNSNVLLDTPDVMALLEKHDVLFVDVRYPAEFEGLGHLPGAVNIPFRKLTTPELEAALRALPKKPVIVPCYDKRSSFFARTIGLRLTRLGYEFLGRYTVPEGFASPGKDKPHVAAWKAAHEDKSLLSVAAAPVKGALEKLEGSLGSLALAILAVVVALRVVVSPLSIKSDRDRILQNALAPKLAELKTKYAGDARGLSRATMRVLRENRIWPLFNLLGTTVQLVAFTVLFSAVDQASRTSTEPLWWMKNLSVPDAARVLPIAIAALLGLQLWISARAITKGRVILIALCAVGIFAITFGLRAGVNLYLVANLALLALQTVITKRAFAADRRQKQAVPRIESASAVVPLRDAHRIDGCGNKAARLGALLEAGFPVPVGFVVRSAAIDRWHATGAWNADDRAAITRAHSALRAAKVAVRSSGANEDGCDKSYAGVFESILDVEATQLFDALERVARSLESRRVEAYASARRESGGIVVQAMVPADHAGVLFTEHPGRSGACAVELVAGLGEDLVAGRKEPLSLCFGRCTGRALDERRAPIDLAPLLELGRKVEALFGKPQDIEWAHASGRFHLLQARDITRLAGSGEDAQSMREAERKRLLELVHGAHADDVVYARNELSELLPQPTPYSLAFMDRLWAHGGSTDLACRELGVPYEVEPDSPPYAVSAFGALLVNRVEERRRMRRGPGVVASFRMSRAGEELERSYRDDFLPQHLRAARMRDALELARFSVADLVDLHRTVTHEFVTHNYVRAEIINVAADFYFKAAVRELEKRGLDPALHLAHMPSNVVQEAMDLLARVGRGEAEMEAFLALFGHRAPHDYELAEPRYAANVELALAMAARSAHVPPRKHHDVELPQQRVLALAVQRARRYQALKEEAKHHALRDLAFLHRLLVELGSRTHLGASIFQLTPDEVNQLDQPAFQREITRRVSAREEARAAFEDVSLPGELTLAALETLDLEHAHTAVIARGTAALKGMRISGSGDVTGVVRVLRHADEIEHFRRGEILVARFTDPTWMPVFPLARGLVTEVGGWLSHAAIQAREYGITGIVNVAGALDALQTGELVALRADGSIERIANRRVEPRVRSAAPVRLRRDELRIDGRLTDFSRRGASLSIASGKLEVGDDIALESDHLDVVLGARVVRNGTPGLYGLVFHAELEPRANALEHHAFALGAKDAIG